MDRIREYFSVLSTSEDYININTTNNASYKLHFDKTELKLSIYLIDGIKKVADIDWFEFLNILENLDIPSNYTRDIYNLKQRILSVLDEWHSTDIRQRVIEDFLEIDNTSSIG